MMRLKERLTETKTVQAEYKGKGTEKEPVYSPYMDMTTLTGLTSIERVRHVFGTKNGDIIRLRPEDVPANLEEGKDYNIEIKKILGIETSKRVIA